MIALVAAASQNAIAANHRSIIDGLILIATIAFWNYALDWLGHRFPRFQRFYYPPPLPWSTGAGSSGATCAGS